MSLVPVPVHIQNSAQIPFPCASATAFVAFMACIAPKTNRSQLVRHFKCMREIFGHRLQRSSINEDVNFYTIPIMGGDVAQLLRASDRHAAETKVRFPGAAKDFSPRVNFQCRLSFSVRTPPCTIACINICAHVKDPVVHVRAWWIMATQTNPACTIATK